MQCAVHYNGRLHWKAAALYTAAANSDTDTGCGTANIPKNVRTIGKERGREEEEQENTNFESLLLSALADLIGGGSHGPVSSHLSLGREFSPL